MAVEEYKTFTDEKDKFYVYAINKNEQYVFKTSIAKMKIANLIDSSESHFLSQEYCCFDGKVKRTKFFTTLTASVYHPLLQKQIALAIMECQSEDSRNIGIFWQEFNRAFKEVNASDEKFNPVGWVSDMATSNFNGLECIYGEDVMTKIKGCEFHYRQSINRHCNTVGNDSEKFKNMATEMLVASTPEAYEAAYKTMKDFLSVHENGKQLLHWLKWWNDRRFNIFRAFTGYNCPRSNLAEVIHASWVHRSQQGLTLLETTEFDIRTL